MNLAEPTPVEPDPSIVTPGVPGFVVFALLAIIVLVLVLSMSRHLRRIDVRAAQEERDEQERAATAASGGPDDVGHAAAVDGDAAGRGAVGTAASGPDQADPVRHDDTEGTGPGEGDRP